MRFAINYRSANSTSNFTLCVWLFTLKGGSRKKPGQPSWENIEQNCNANIISRTSLITSQEKS
jgi:hypothetical protein